MRQVELKKRVMRILSENKNKRITNREIRQRLDISISPVKIRDAIHSLRIDGYLIVASQYGYKLTDNTKEALEYLSNLQQRGRSILKVVSRMKESIEKRQFQNSLF